MIALGIAALAFAAGSAVYGAHEQKSAEEKASANLNPLTPPKPSSGGFSTQSCRECPADQRAGRQLPESAAERCDQQCAERDQEKPAGNMSQEDRFLLWIVVCLALVVAAAAWLIIH